MTRVTSSGIVFLLPSKNEKLSLVPVPVPVAVAVAVAVAHGAPYDVVLSLRVSYVRPLVLYLL